MSDDEPESCINCGDEIDGEGFYAFSGAEDVKGLDALDGDEPVPIDEVFGFNDGPYCTLDCSLDGDADE